MTRRAAMLAIGVLAVFSLACGGAGANKRGKGERETRRPARGGDDDVVRIEVRPDGRMEPAEVDVSPGETVVWRLSDRYRDSIVPLEGDQGRCEAIAPWSGDGMDFTGPLPRNPSGVFVLGQDGPGMVAKWDGRKGSGPTPELKKEGPLGSVPDELLASDGVAGVYFRLRWNWIQPDHEGAYDWTIVDRLVQAAVDEGKLYSLHVKAGAHGTPDWIFDAGVERLIFRDGGSHVGRDECQCGTLMALGSPTDERYEELYLEMLTELAKHLKSNAAWYRHLAYVKPSGANLFTAENRLPKSCSCSKDCKEPCGVPAGEEVPGLQRDGRICNTEVWAKAGYTPEGLYSFYVNQFDTLAREFPDKDMVYMLIQAGWPQVAGPKDYLTCGGDPKASNLPGPTEQTRKLLRIGWKKHGSRFAIQHAGFAAGHRPNRMLIEEKNDGQIIGTQTVNMVRRADDLGATFDNLVKSTPATFLEVWERAAWDAEWTGGCGTRSLEEWNETLHERRREQAGEGALRDPFPTEHRFTVPADAAPGSYRYVNPRRCDAGKVGVLRVKKK